MTKYCPNCGKPYEEGVAFCAGCGTSLNGAKPAKPSFKSAITKKGLSEVAGKSVKVFTIIVLVLSLIFAVQNIFGNVDLCVDQYRNGKLAGHTEVIAKDLYPGAGNDETSYATGVMVANIIYGVASVGVAALAAWVLLEKACGGDYKKIFKLMGLVAMIAAAVYILIYLIFAAKQTGSGDYIVRIAVEAPVDAWVALVTYGLTFTAGLLQPKD